MSLELYYAGASAPCRAVLLTAKALNLKLNLKEIDLQKKEQFKPEFLKINPQHVVPTLKDNEFVIWESRAIQTYLVNKYGGRDDKLYPKDPKVRGLIDQRMYFDALTLYKAFGDLYYPVLFFGKTMDDENMKKAQAAFELFDVLLDPIELGTVDDNITIADLTLVATVSSFDALNFNLNPYKRVLAWYQRMKDNAPGYQELNEKNLDVFRMLGKMHFGEQRAAEVVEKAPEVVEKAPEVVKKAPEVVEKAPEVVERAPEVVEKAPEVVENTTVSNEVVQNISENSEVVDKIEATVEIEKTVQKTTESVETNGTIENNVENTEKTEITT